MSMLRESDAILLWRKLFRGQTVTSLTLIEADSVVDQLHPESPLRHRFSREIDELRGMQERAK